MGKGGSNREAQELGALIDRLDLADTDKAYMRARWLDQVTWHDKTSRAARKRYYRLRVTSVVGGVVVPALVSLNIGTSTLATWVKWLTFAVSLMVALSVAVEQLFHYGDRWRHYRATVEALKSEGWQFFQRSGAYHRYAGHQAAYPYFAARVEDILSQNVESYLTEVVSERQKREEQPTADGAH